MDKKCPKCGSDDFAQTLMTFNNKASCNNCDHVFLVDILEKFLSEESKEKYRESIIIDNKQVWVKQLVGIFQQNNITPEELKLYVEEATKEYELNRPKNE